MINETKDTLESDISNQMSRMSTHLDNVEQNLSLNLEKVNRETDRLKTDVVEMIEQKQEQMLRTFAAELSGIKKKYEEATTLVTDASTNLVSLF